MLIRRIVTTLSLLALGACAAIQLPAERLEGTQASIRSAQELGATGVPASKLHLQLAKDQAGSAKALAAKGDQRAPLMLARAEADAELSLGLARQVAVHTEALRAEKELEAVEDRPQP